MGKVRLMDGWLTRNLVCPRDHTNLQLIGHELVCFHAHSYPVVDGIPVMLLDDTDQTCWWATDSLKRARSLAGSISDEKVFHEDAIDPFVQIHVAGTCGILYRPLVGKLRRYPLPELRLSGESGQILLDVGCNWGRWSAAAALKGFYPIGIDPSLDAIFAARRVFRQLGLTGSFVVGDARFLPFRSGTLDTTFSYSVLQHLSKNNARSAFSEISRVLKVGGSSLVQMPNKFGVRCLYHQAKRRFREGRDFDVRYWNISELKRAFQTTFGNATVSVDGYFGLGIQASDMDMLPPLYRIVPFASEILRRFSLRAHCMTYIADSVYVKSIKTESAS